jgi:hypothetical protein
VAKSPKASKRVNECPALRRAEDTVLCADKEYWHLTMHKLSLICDLLKAAQMMWGSLHRREAS